MARVAPQQIARAARGQAKQAKKTASKAKGKGRRVVSDDEDEGSASSSSGEGEDGEAYEEDSEVEEEDAESVASLDSENLDAESGGEERKKAKKRKSTGGSKSGSPKKVKADTGGKNTREIKKAPLVAAPKSDPETHLILPSTMDFLKNLAKHNDRDWFQQHDAGYRHAWKNWNAFVTKLVPTTSEADWTIPPMPSKDLVHRIYRDVRFSQDKTPYKKNFSASLSRTGRKGPFCLYYVHIQPGDRSILAAGKWQPDGNDLATIRHSFLRDPKPFKKIINEKEFVKLFGEAKHKGRGVRSNVFGHDDELKNCPKLPNVTKEHPDIDLLRLRSVAVSTTFTDDEVLADDFIERLGRVMKVAAPFVQAVNEMLHPTPRDDSDDGNNDGNADEGEDESEEAAEEDEDRAEE